MNAGPDTARPIALFALALWFAALGCVAAEPSPADKTPTRVTITAGSYFFKPDRITVKVGMPVELTVVKESGMTPHNFVLHAPAAGIDVEQELGSEPVRVTFTPKAAGKFPFYCGKKPPFFASHRERGMEGVLEVVD